MHKSQLNGPYIYIVNIQDIKENQEVQRHLCYTPIIQHVTGVINSDK